MADQLARPLVDLVNGVASRIARRPVQVRAKLTPDGLLRGEVDVLVVEVREIPIAKLLVDRLVIRAEGVRLRPGWPPHLVSTSVGCKAVVSQAGVDRWTHTLRLPFRLELTKAGIVVHTGVGGVRMSEVLAEIEPVGPLLRLRPTKASFLGVNAPGIGLLRGYLPLPPLPASATIDRIETTDGELAAFVDLGDIDVALTPDLTKRLRKRFSIG